MAQLVALIISILATLLGISLFETTPDHLPGGYTLEHEVAGYYVGSSSLRSLRDEKTPVSMVVPFAYGVQANGNLKGSSPAEALAFAGTNNLRTLMLVHNVLDGNFDGPLIHQILNDPVAKEQLLTSILRELETWGYSGVNIDFENVPPADRGALTGLIQELADLLQPRGLLVTMSIPAKERDNPANTWSGAFDYPALGAACDYVMLMTYDQHYRTGPPGPIASIEWVESVIRYATATIPANKIMLGLAAYGYDWHATGYKSWTASVVTPASAVSLAAEQGVPVRRDQTSKSPYFRYWTGGIQHHVWYEDAYSLSYKTALVRRYGLAGVALWRLGFENRQIRSLLGRL